MNKKLTLITLVMLANTGLAFSNKYYPLLSIAATTAGAGACHGILNWYNHIRAEEFSTHEQTVVDAKTPAEKNSKKATVYEKIKEEYRTSAFNRVCLILGPAAIGLTMDILGTKKQIYGSIPAFICARYGYYTSL